LVDLPVRSPVRSNRSEERTRWQRRARHAEARARRRSGRRARQGRWRPCACSARWAALRWPSWRWTKYSGPPGVSQLIVRRHSATADKPPSRRRPGRPFRVRTSAAAGTAITSGAVCAGSSTARRPFRAEAGRRRGHREDPHRNESRDLPCAHVAVFRHRGAPPPLTRMRSQSHAKQEPAGGDPGLLPFVHRTCSLVGAAQAGPGVLGRTMQWNDSGARNCSPGEESELREL
jgi:hypothetical protein